MKRAMIEIEQNILGLVLSARHGSCRDFASFMLPKEQIIALGDLNLEPCSKCDYECFRNAPCPKNDDMRTVYDAWMKSDAVIVFSPVYDGRPPSLYCIFEERIPSFWMRSQEGFGRFGGKDCAIVVVGNQDCEKTLEILRNSLGGFAMKIKSTLIVHPHEHKIGGGIKGGLIGNPEIREKLKLTLDVLTRNHKDS